MENQYDLVIVGAGVAGWTAACRAQDLGASVAVLEKFHGAPSFGNGRMSGGWFHAAMRDPREAPDNLYQTLIDLAGGYAREELARAWADNVGRAVHYLDSMGGHFEAIEVGEEMEKKYPKPMTSNVLTPYHSPRFGRDFHNSGPDLLLRELHRQFVEGGGTFLSGHRARRLEMTDGAIVGVWADNSSGEGFIAGRSVLLCDGGFQGNADLVARYITSAYQLRGSTSNTGDGFLMGLEAGAVPVNMEWFYGYPQHRDALFDDRLWPTPTPVALVAHGIVVDATGSRFADEELRQEQMADAIANSVSPGGCWVIFDQDTWLGPGCAGEDFAINPVLTELGATVVEAASLAELARLVQIPEAALTKTVDAINASRRDGSSIVPVRSGELPTIEKAPFYAVPLIAGITFAMGGLLVNKNAQVVDSDEQPIPGLYAAGGTMGGLQGGPGSKGYAGGWAEASTFGLLAAEHVASQH